MSSPRRRIDPNFYYGTVEMGTRLGLPTREIWGLIRDQAEAAGLVSPGITAAEVSRMRGAAAATRTADAQLARAGAQLALDASMISRARWARDPGQRDTTPMWQIRFKHSTLVDGQPSEDWRTLMIRGSLPATVAALHRRVGRAAGQLAKDYEAEHVGIDDLSILEI